MSINGKRYDWESVNILMPQGIAIDITDISYSDGQAIAARYGKGAVAQGYGRQNYEGSGSFTIDAEEFERLKLAIRKKSIYDHEPFPIVVNYADEGAPVITDKLPKCKITKISTSNSQGSENAGARSIEYTILEPIDYNGTPAK
jgi:hypothetical protein